MTMEVIQWIVIALLFSALFVMIRIVDDVRKEADRMVLRDCEMQRAVKGINSKMQEHDCGFHRISNWYADSAGIVRDKSEELRLDALSDPKESKREDQNQ